MSNTSHLLHEEESPLWTILHANNGTLQLNESDILLLVLIWLAMLLEITGDFIPFGLRSKPIYSLKSLA